MAFFLDIYVMFNFKTLKDNETFQVFVIFIESENPFHIPHKSQSSGFALYLSIPIMYSFSINP